MITKGRRGSLVGAIYHDEPPKFDAKRKTLHTGDTVVSGPIEIPAYVMALKPSIDQLLKMWRKGAPKKSAGPILPSSSD